MTRYIIQNTQVEKLPDGWTREYMMCSEHHYRYDNGDDYYTKKVYEDKPLEIFKRESVEYGGSGTRARWDSYFDTSTGEMIDSYDKVKEKERSGMVYCSPDEAQAEARKNRKHIDAEYSRGEQKRFDERMMPVLKRQGLI